MPYPTTSHILTRKPSPCSRDPQLGSLGSFLTASPLGHNCRAADTARSRRAAVPSGRGGREQNTMIPHGHLWQHFFGVRESKTHFTRQPEFLCSSPAEFQMCTQFHVCMEQGPDWVSSAGLGCLMAAQEERGSPRAAVPGIKDL